ncbi:hypothetical protein EUX98_g1383 [Antrodiella citrinella]|uniref:Uncharacterized protein n=1 Tax=Antrodiella citrinella TaxID=2447956 RepID=A0A4S4N1K1_9APHY|nr:hypothetical protein EUX98_g1383 [Antrodiella citrinella]
MVIAGVVLLAYGTRSKRTDFDNTGTNTPTWQHRIEQQRRDVDVSKSISNAATGTEPPVQSNVNAIPLPGNKNNTENGGSWITTVMQGKNPAAAQAPGKENVRNRVNEKGTTYTKTPAYSDPKSSKPEGYGKTPGDKK